MILFLIGTQLFSKNIEVYGVNLPENEISYQLRDYKIAIQQQNVFKMDSLQTQLYKKLDKFSVSQKAVWHLVAGTYFIHIDLYDQAADQFSQCIQICDRKDYHKLMLYARNGMANVEYSHKNIDEALTIFYKIIGNCTEDDWEIKGKVHANIAPLLFEKAYWFETDENMKDSLHQLSDEHYKMAIEILEKNEGWFELSRVYSLYARSLMRDNLFDGAKKYIELSAKLSKLVNNDYRYNFNLIKWSEYYDFLKDRPKAIDSAKKALVYFKKVGNGEMQHYAMAVISSYYARSYKYDSAFVYAMNMDKLKRTMGLVKMAKQSRQYKIELEVFDKENQLKEQAIQIELQTLENQISEAKTKRWALGGISGIAIVILIALIFIQRQKQKAKVERAQLIIEEREQAFRSVIDGQEAERKRIAQELHDGIGQQLSGLKMALQNMASSMQNQEENFHNQLNSVVSLVSETSSEVRHLAHQMLPQVLEEKGLSEALKDLIQSTYQATKIKFNYKDQLDGLQLEKPLKLTVYRCIQELINNTIKYAKASEIDLYIYESSNNLLVAYSDNGVGVDLANLKKGLGLNGIRHRLENFKGTFTIDTNNPKGFNAMLKLPLS